MTEAATDAAAAAASGRWGRAGRQAGLFGMAVGMIAVGAAAGVAIERATVGRSIRRKARIALDAAGPFGTLRGEPGTAVAEDGTRLYYEIDPVDPQTAAAARPARGPGRRRTDSAPLTVVFCHGYTLNQDSFHYQRAALRGLVRTVYWDHRGHGRSERGTSRLDGGGTSIDLLGRDLKAVIDAAAPEGPLVLVGHSMGGMTVMAFADQFPRMFAERVAGVAFIGTTAGKLSEVTFGLPAVGARALHRLAPVLLRTLGRRPQLAERGRKAAADLLAAVVKRYSFGSDVDPAVARFAERMIESTPIDVVAEFFPAFAAHEKTAALAGLAGVPVLVLAGEKDLVTPADHSAAIAAKVSSAELVVILEGGHLMMLEHPDLINGHLAGLLIQAAGFAGAPLPERIHAMAGPKSTGGHLPVGAG